MFGGLKKSRKKTLALDDQRESPLEKTNIDDDPEIQKLDRTFELFLAAQELMPREESNGKLLFSSEEQKLRYLHFKFGAIDRLSRAIQDQHKATYWQYVSFGVHAHLLYGIDDATGIIKSYGRTGDNKLHSSGEAGWNAMGTWINSAIGNVSEQEFNKSCLALSKLLSSEGL